MADEGPAGITQVYLYGAYDANAQQALSPQAIAQSGGSLAHDNIQPYLALNFIIAYEGIYPQHG